MGYMSSENTLHSTRESEPSLWFANIRSMISYAEAVERRQQTVEAVEAEMDASEQHTTSDPLVWDSTSGSSYEVKEFHESVREMIYRCVNYDAGIWNTLHYINSIFLRMDQKVSEMTSAFADNDILENDFNEILEKIKTNEDYGRAALLTLTRDQVMLGKSLFDSMSELNRQYPYLPASKALMINQAKNLATVSNLSEFIRTESSGRKRILAVGLPAGLIEYMRNKAIDEIGDIAYRQSNIICINVFRRNLLNDSEYCPPKQFYFDVSKFIIQGRSTGTSVESSLIDAADGWTSGQSTNDLFSNTVFRGYDPDGQSTSTIGKMYDDAQGNMSIDRDTMMRNHIKDYYLKLYLMLTTGMDVSEDSFPFLDSDIVFSEVDPGFEEVYEDMAAQAAEMFPTRDVTSAINYERLLGELRRSILLSPKKWRNRIVYPKMFDRVLCVLVDESEDFVSSTTSPEEVNIEDYTDPITGETIYANTSSESNGNIAVSREDDLRSPTYYQFYTTLSLHYPISDGELETYELEEELFVPDAVLASAIEQISDLGVEMFNASVILT